MQDDRRYYSGRAAMEFTLAAQATDPVTRRLHTETAEAYAQLAAIPPAPANDRHRPGG